MKLDNAGINVSATIRAAASWSFDSACFAIAFVVSSVAKDANKGVAINGGARGGGARGGKCPPPQIIFCPPFCPPSS